MRAKYYSLLAVLFTVPAQATATIYNLGTLAGGEYSFGNAVNASGQVVGRANSEDKPDHAFVHTGAPGGGGVMHDIGTLEGTLLNWVSTGYGINNSGQVTGVSEKVVGYDYNWHAFLYSGTPGSGGVMYDLGTLGGADSYGCAINDSGQVAGVSERATGGYSARHAFRYDGTPGSGGIMRDLGTLGGAYSTGEAINASGQVAGVSQVAGNAAEHAFLYTGTPGTGGVMHDLGTLGGTSSWSYAINASGQVVGRSQIAGNAAAHAFGYIGTPGSGGAMVDLGTLGGTYSAAWGINDSGLVVGMSNTAGNAAQHAFLYTGTPGLDGQMIDLDTWLDATHPAEGAKWRFFEQVHGLTNTGLITGNGYYNDGPGGLSDGNRAFLLDVSTLIFTPGDASKDGIINSVDFDFLAASYGTLAGATWQMGDFDGDNKVTTTDFNLLAGHFGAPAAMRGANVPEPAMLGLLLPVGVAALRFRRRGRVSQQI